MSPRNSVGDPGSRIQEPYSGACIQSLVVLALIFTAIQGSSAPPVLTEKWSVLLPNPSESSPAIGKDGTVYLGLWNGDLRAIGADGSPKWVFHAGREIRSSPAIASDGTVYFGSRNRRLYALATGGKLKWMFATGAWVDSSPAIALDGTVYFGSWDNSFYAVSPDGIKKWQFNTGGAIVSSPAIGAGRRIYFGSHDRKFYCVTPEGQKSWEYCTGGPIISSPAVAEDGAVYFTSVDGFFYSLDIQGRLAWRLKTGGVTASSPVIGQDHTIYIGVNNTLWAIQPDGKERWERAYGSGPIENAPLALADGSVCFVSAQGVLVNLNGPNGLNWSFDQHWYAGVSPTVARNDTVYTLGHVLGTGTFLYALPISVPLAHSAWPKFRGNLPGTGNVAAEVDP